MRRNVSTRLAARRTHRSVLWAILLIALAAALVRVQDARAQSRSIEEVMAAFIYQFTNYVEWPDSAFESESSPLRICIVGNDDMARHLEKLTGGKTFNDRPIDVHSIADLEEASSATCHLLFVGQDALDETESMPTAHEVMTLTIGESKTFTRNGGVIRLFESQSKVRIEINIDAAKRGSFKISSKLLALAEIVHDGNGD